MNSWKTVSLTKKGLSHVSSGTNCQDCVNVAENECFVVAALADGLGSLSHSELASQIATQAVCDYFFENSEDYSDGIKKERKPSVDAILDYVQSRINEEANQRGLSTVDMDCTIAFVCVSKINNHALIGLLGDSAICVIAKEKSVVINDGNRTANGTYAVLDRDAKNHFQLHYADLDADEILGFILTSDGLENELYIKGSPRIRKIAASYFNTLTESDSAESTILDRIKSITSQPNSPFDDDISVIILSRANNKIELPSDPTWLCSCGEHNPLQNTYCQACHKDFTVLYQNIRFKDYGGKAAFFERINADPDRERFLVGLPPISKNQIETVTTRVTPPSALPINETKKNNHLTTKQAANPEIEQNVSISQPCGYSIDISAKEVRKNKPKSGQHQRTPNKDVSDQHKSATKTSAAEPNNNTDENEKEKTNMKGNKSNKQKTISFLPIVLAFVCVIVGAVMGSVVTKSFVAKKIDTLSSKIEILTSSVKKIESEINQQPQPTTAPIELPNEASEAIKEEDNPKNFNQLSDDTFFWGTLSEDGKPIGLGVLQQNEDYYIGSFEDGLKNGLFAVSSSSDNNISIELYEYDSLISSSDISSLNDIQTKIVIHETPICRYPYEDGLPLGILVPGDEVSVVISSEIEVDGVGWRIVKTNDNLTGWVKNDSIE